MSLQNFLIKIGLIICIFLSIITFSSIFNFYYVGIIVITLSLLALYLVYLLLKRKLIIKDKKDLIIFLIIFLFSIFSGIFHHDMPIGRDDMGYIAAASQLNKHHGLSFKDPLFQPGYSFFNIKDDLITSQFLPAYIGYLAVFQKLGGIKILFWANSILVFFFLFSVYFVSKNLLNYKTGFVTVILCITSFSYNWFPRRTNSENLFMYLIWMWVWIMFYAFKKQKKEYLFLSLIPISLTLLTRIEGVIFLAIFILSILFFYFFVQKNINNNINNKYKFLGIGFLLFIIFQFITYLLLHNPTYFVSHFKKIIGLKEIIFLSLIVIFSMLFIRYLYLKREKIYAKIDSQRYFFPPSILIILLFLILFFLALYPVSGILEWRILIVYYTFIVFVEFFLLIPIIFSILLLFKKLNYKILLLIFVCSPSFYLLFNPFIALDIPWFLRRFISVFIPLCYILFSYFIFTFKPFSSKIRIILVILFIYVQLIISLPILTFIEHKSLNQEILKISKNIGPNDLVIVQSNRRWSKIGIIMHYIYYKNTIVGTDNSEKLISRYKNLFVLKEKNSPFLEENYDLIEVNDFLLTFPELERKARITSQIKHDPRLSLKYILNAIEKLIPQKIINYNFHLYLFRVAKY